MSALAHKNDSYKWGYLLNKRNNVNQFTNSTQCTTREYNGYTLVNIVELVNCFNTKPKYQYQYKVKIKQVRGIARQTLFLLLVNFQSNEFHNYKIYTEWYTTRRDYYLRSVRSLYSRYVIIAWGRFRSEILSSSFCLPTFCLITRLHRSMRGRGSAEMEQTQHSN